MYQSIERDKRNKCVELYVIRIRYVEEKTRSTCFSIYILLFYCNTELVVNLVI